MRYRLDVVAADVVRFAGGWLFDRAMAGWDVPVLIADHPDDRPLQILGVQVSTRAPPTSRVDDVPCSVEI